MGQKIHPVGFRIGITKKQKSQWFARFQKHQYSQAVLEDHLIRETLFKLFGGNSPELSPQGTKTGKKSQDSQKQSAKITQIKIERGLIPYEIGIQIHAGNCDFIKSSIDNLKLNQSLTQQLQKSRRYLMDLKLKMKEVLNWNLSSSSTAKNSKVQTKSKLTNLKLIQKRIRKRIGVKRNFRQSVLNHLWIIKKGKKFVRQIQSGNSQNSRKLANFKKTEGLKPFSSKVFNSKVKELSSSLKEIKTGVGDKAIENFLQLSFGEQSQSSSKIKREAVRFTSFNQNAEATKGQLPVNGRLKLQNSRDSRNSKTQLSSNLYFLGKSPSKNKKFLQVFVSQTNQDFLKTLKTQMKYWNTYFLSCQERIEKGEANLLAPLGYNKRWSLSRLSRLKNQPVSLLRNLVKSLQSKALLKLDLLREEYLSLGSLSKIQSFEYYQMMLFIKNLKILVRKVGREQMKLVSDKDLRSNSHKLSATKIARGPSSASKKNKLGKWIYSLSSLAFRGKLDNIDKECRKLKFLYYLKDLVQKHRKNHLYYYLPTIKSSQQSLEKLRKFQNKNASFLFGIDLSSFPSTKNKASGEINDNLLKTEQVQKKIKNAYLQLSQKSDLNKGLQEAFLEQLQKQKTMYRQNIQLTPKILIKFYKVNESNYEFKASLVADSIVDDLEKRKAFRKVIKDAKEKLMANSGVKGVKIQVGGRLNGAEIARTEWVRSGRVPLQTLRANIDYSYKTASTIYGIIGVKVWIYKGYAKLQKQSLPSLFALA
uniref:ribosomal protein S3 n=1 Tax=Parallela transversalis TaxID=163324 RepID=UPI0010C3201A|nr:ribosomal protein S3 [Parallela transversalis]AYQ22856.1 ribosomal protein S3 [Parallela transversalis]